MKVPALLFPTLLLALFACAEPTDERGPRLFVLAHGGVPSAWTSTETALVIKSEAPEGWIRVGQTIAPEAWSPSLFPDVYSTRLRLPGTGFPPGREGPHELHFAGAELNLLPFSRELLELEALSDGSYVVLGDELLLLDVEGRYVKAELEYQAWFERGYRDEGRVNLPGATGEGFLLFAGERIDLALPSVASDTGAILQFTAAAYGGSIGETSTTLTVEVDGEVVLREELPNVLRFSGEQQRIVLPDSEGAKIAFRAEAGSGLLMILNPVLFAADVDPVPRRPDFVIFLADTFRADNLEAWGGAPNLAPRMNAFARESQVFVSSHAPASWTLPSQASLLSGAYPFQHGVTGGGLALAEDLPTLARVFSAAGYRTAAVTDGLLVSERFGLDQGFETFLEEHGGKDFRATTLERVQQVLDADDGRPLLLFVQSYRVHTPYAPSLEALLAHPELFGEDPDLEEWEFRKLFRAAGLARKAALEGRESDFEGAGERLRRLYLGGVVDLDSGYGEFLDMLEAAGLGDAYLLFTSDHGEAFGEHGEWTHGSGVFDEQVRIPFILRGPGLGSGVVEDLVSLVDVPPTFARLAGLELDPSWAGRSLFDPEEGEACVFSFQCVASTEENPRDSYALIQGSRKIIGRVERARAVREVVHAFDLSGDPAEATDLESSSAAWPDELLQRWGERLDEVTRLDAPPKPLVLLEAELADLRAMGYFGD